MSENIESALYLIPVTLGDTSYERVLPEYNRGIISQIKVFVVESKRSAIRFLKLVSPEIDIDSLTFHELNEHTEAKDFVHYLDALVKEKKPVGVISDAGCPAVADPGSQMVEIAHRRNIRVIPLVGPSSMILAVMGSGFNGQSFAFNGYLPVKPNERTARLRQLENRACSEKQTQLFIEAPYRNVKMFETIISTCRKTTYLCIASGVTTAAEYIRTKTVEQWKKDGAPDFNKIPSIFLIYGA